MIYDFYHYHKENNAHIYAFGDSADASIESVGFLHADNLSEANAVLQKNNHAARCHDVLLNVPEKTCCKELERRVNKYLQKRTKEGIANGLSEAEAEQSAREQINKTIKRMKKDSIPFKKYMVAKASTRSEGNSK